MPQINITEIDESVFTRVVSDDLVKVLVPGISSFGPVVSNADTTDFSDVTFTDVTEFRKTFGHNEPEYNPFKHDVSRIYAEQLIQRGAAVTFLRVNQGTTAIYNKDKAIVHSDTNFTEADVTYTKLTLEPSDWTTKYYTYYTKEDDTYTPVAQSAIVPTFEANKYYSRTVDNWNTIWTTLYTKNGSTYVNLAETLSYVELADSNAPANWGTANTFYVKNITTGEYELVSFTGAGTEQSPYVPAYVANKYYIAPTQNSFTTYYKTSTIGAFCPQIDRIEAKYTGSFGNRLLVTFTPVTSVNTYYAYQYSNVTVYRADIVVETTKDSNGIVTVTKKIKNVHKLESKTITTNPDDVNYFGNADLFKYIIIHPTATAYDELSLTWSNTTVNPLPGEDVYSGFPEVRLKYTDNNGIVTYNEDALLTGGSDFIFNDGLPDTVKSLQDILKEGFGGFVVSGDEEKTTIANVNRWVWASYRPNGVIDTVLSTIANCYQNYTDPYIYDFDFITAGGFVDETYTIYAGDSVLNPSDINNYISPQANPTAVLKAVSDWDSEIVPLNQIQNIHASMLNLANTRQDCIALIDTGANWDANNLTDYVALLNTSFATVHAPWCYCKHPYMSGTVLMPPSFVFVYTMLSNLINNVEAQKWFPPAGVTRATARIVKRPKYEIGSVILNKWQNDSLSRVNPIMKLKNYGYVIYGQYTAYVAQDEYTHSALESLNVRLVSNCVKKQIFNTCLKLTFEPNNSTLWMRFYDAIDTYLLFMKRNNGLYDYRVQMDESTVTTDDINELRCPGKVWINPTRTAEFFDIDFILTEAGVSFSDNAGGGE
jgi:hypothetical protein